MNQEIQTLRINIKISNKDFERYNQYPADLLNQLLLHKNELDAFVLNHMQDLDGAPELTDYKVSGWSYKKENLQGKFRLHFAINRRFCCSDQESCRNDYMDFSFTYTNEVLRASASYFDWTISS